MTSSPEDIVVTGMGAVTPLGVGVDVLIRRWLAGEDHLVDGCGPCDDFDPLEHLSRRAVRISDRFTQLTLVAAQEALTQAGLADDSPYAPDRMGCVLASGVGGLLTIEGDFNDFQAGRPRSPHAVPAFMINGAAASLAIRHGWRGESHAFASACASGVQVLGSGVRLLRCDELDAVIVGAADAKLSTWGRGGFEVMGVLSPTGRCRPWDRRRDGFLPGEGAGLFVLERRASAEARGATPIAEILSVAASNDAYHLALPPEEGHGLQQAMATAMERCGLRPSDIDYVNPHGASSPIGDRVETVAIKHAFGEEAPRVPISSTKSAIGHLIGAAGAVETISAILALRHGQAPPTLGLEEPEEGLDLWYVPDEGPVPIRDRAEKGYLAALSFSFGLGGHNAAAVVAVDREPEPAHGR